MESYRVEYLRRTTDHRLYEDVIDDLCSNEGCNMPLSSRKKVMIVVRSDDEGETFKPICSKCEPAVKSKVKSLRI